MLHNPLIIGIILALAIVGTVTVCKGRRFRHSGFKTKFAQHLVSRKLKLTESQREALKAGLEKVREARAKQAADRSQYKAEVIELVLKEHLTVGDLVAALAKHKPKMESMKSLVFEEIVKFHKILTSEQKEKLAKLIEKFNRRFGRCSRFG